MGLADMSYLYQREDIAFLSPDPGVSRWHQAPWTALAGVAMIRYIVFAFGLGALLAWACPTFATAFLTEVVDPSPSASGTSLALDAQGRPHITYSLGNSLRHTYRTTGGWISETIPGVAYAGRRSFAIGPAGEPIVSYWSLSGSLNLATKTGGTWTSEVVHSYGGIVDALTLDAAGSVHLLSYLGNGSLVHSHRVEGAWVNQAITSTGGQPPLDMDIRIDSQARPHIAAEQFYGRQVFHSYEVGADWVQEVIDETPPGAQPTHSVSLALDSLDRPVVAFTDAAANTLKFARRASSDWVVEAVFGTAFGQYTNLALDPRDAPHIMYSDGALRYVTRPGTSWTVETVIAGGSGAAMKLDGSGAAHVAYVGMRGIQYSRVIDGNVTFGPNTVNSQRHGAWITGYVESSDFAVASVDPTTIRLEGAVASEPKFATIGDQDADGIPDLMVKFRTEDLLPLLATGATSLAMTGRLATGEEFKMDGMLRRSDAAAAAAFAGLSLRIVSAPGAARVEYVLENPQSGSARLQVFDVRGRLVRSWDDAPSQTVHGWDGRGSGGTRVGSGVYFLLAEAGGQRVSRRLVVSR